MLEISSFATNVSRLSDLYPQLQFAYPLLYMEFENVPNTSVDAVELGEMSWNEEIYRDTLLSRI